MTIAELHAKYTGTELTWSEGDRELRYNAFAPLLQNLHQGRLVYHESNWYAIVNVSDLRITRELFSATAEVYLKIMRRRSSSFPVSYPSKPWTFSASWEYLTCGSNCLYGYSTFTIWPEPLLVAAVQDLVDSGDHDGAYGLLWPGDDESC